MGSAPVGRERVLRYLRDHEADLRAAGVGALYLFGSMRRGEAGRDSDVDLLFDPSPDVAPSLIDRLRLKHALEDDLGCPVDLLRRDALLPDLRDRILAEAERIF